MLPEKDPFRKGLDLFFSAPVFHRLMILLNNYCFREIVIIFATLGRCLPITIMRAVCPYEPMPRPINSNDDVLKRIEGQSLLWDEPIHVHRMEKSEGKIGTGDAVVRGMNDREKLNAVVKPARVAENHPPEQKGMARFFRS